MRGISKVSVLDSIRERRGPTANQELQIKRWYWAGEERQHGPVPASRIIELIRSGELGQADLVWRPGLEDWVRVEETETFGHLFRPPRLGNHSLERPCTESRIEKRRRRLFAGIFLFAILGGVLSFIGWMGPDTKVVKGAQLSKEDLKTLRSEGILEPNEVPVSFYSAGLWSIREDGNVLSDKRVISYWQQEDELLKESANYYEIVDVAVGIQGDALFDTVIFVKTVWGNLLKLYASVEAGGDEIFLNELTNRWEAARPSGKVLEKGTLPDMLVEFLRTAGIITADEEPLWFYSAGENSVLEDGNLISAQRIVSYWVEEGSLTVKSARFPEIASLTSTGKSIGPQKHIEILVEMVDGTGFFLLLPDSLRGACLARDLVEDSGQEGTMSLSRL